MVINRAWLVGAAVSELPPAITAIESDPPVKRCRNVEDVPVGLAHHCTAHTPVRTHRIAAREPTTPVGSHGALNPCRDVAHASKRIAHQWIAGKLAGDCR